MFWKNGVTTNFPNFKSEVNVRRELIFDWMFNLYYNFFVLLLYISLCFLIFVKFPLLCRYKMIVLKYV